MKLFIHTPVPGITKLEPHGDPRLWVRQTIFPCRSATEIEVVCDRASANDGSKLGSYCSVKPIIGEGVKTLSLSGSTDSSAMSSSISFGDLLLFKIRTPAANLIDRRTRSR